MGGGQENGRRGGTENVPYIAGLGRAADLLFEKRQSPIDEEKELVDGWKYNLQHTEAMRERLLNNLVQGLGESAVRTNGPSDPRKRLPNTLSVGIKGVQSGELLANIGNIVACSAGSACHSSGSHMSYSAILKAVKTPPEYAIGTLRLSVGPDTTKKDVDRAAKVIYNNVHEDANVIFGALVDDEITDGTVSITVLATGFYEDDEGSNNDSSGVPDFLR